jgi:capsid protein
MHESDPELSLALQQSLNRLKLAEDCCDLFDRLVDMSEIPTFGDPGERMLLPGLVDMGTAYSRALIYPGAAAFAYINEIELRQIRARSRVFAQTNPYAIGAARNRAAYAVGNGHTYMVLPRDPKDSDETMLVDCRTVLDDFRKRNKWSKRQKETVRRLDRDGERFLRLFVDAERGELNVRFVEPLEVQNPPNRSAADGVYFGIEFQRIQQGEWPPIYDIETPVNYFLVNIDALGAAIGLRETVPAAEMQHLKANVDLTWPRGLPTWYALQGHLVDAVRTLKATGKIVEFRAKIGMIRRHINGSQQAMLSAFSTANGQTNVKTAGAYPYASIIDTNDAVQYQFPSQTTPVDKNVAAIQAELRACAAALAMPEYMLSGDASNANYSSTMVAEGPAVKTFEELQADLIEADVEIMERQLEIAARAGLIRGVSEDEVLARVRVEAEPPLIKSENRLQEAQADQILREAQVLSKETMAARHGLVYAQQRDKMEIEDNERE